MGFDLETLGGVGFWAWNGIHSTKDSKSLRGFECFWLESSEFFFFFFDKWKKSHYGDLKEVRS